MDFTLYLQDAIDLVSAWEVPDEDFAQVVNDQARLMAGLGMEPSSNTFNSEYFPPALS